MSDGKLCYLVYETGTRNSAASKAPADVAEVCRSLGGIRLGMPPFQGREGTPAQKLWLLTVAGSSWLKNAARIPKGAVVLYQHPNYGIRLTRTFMHLLRTRRDCRFVALIHDLESLRGGIAGAIRENRSTHRLGDGDFLKLFDAVICHNDRMKQYLISQGFPGEKLVSLGLFDYLTDLTPRERRKGDNPTLAIAGYLAPGKCRYIYNIFENGANPTLSVNLYGRDFRADGADPRLQYRGSFPAEELPARLQGDFGLVWDGVSAETCAGNTGEYLRFNNPHKTSLYLAAGLPVIVWREAAVADFVTQNGVGLTMDSLRDLEAAIRGVTPETYEAMCKNAAKVSEKLRSGAFTRAALDAAFDILAEQESKENA